MDDLPGYSPDDLPGRQAHEAPPPEPHEIVEEAVRRRFTFYDERRDGAILTFFVERPEMGFDDAFDELIDELRPQGFLPILRQEGGEHILRVVPSPPVPMRRRFLNVALYVATWITTTMAGAAAWFVYNNPDFCIECYGFDAVSSLYYSQEALWGGFVFYALPLMLILTVHEMGHYIASRRHGLTPSMPYFIPVPPIFPVNIGTLGAFISLREPIPTRKALLDIGASGPIFGLVVAVPVVLVGAVFMAASPAPVPPDAGSATLGTPLLYTILVAPFGLMDNAYIHPTALAGWVGLLVTGINLLPAGQLDGGHIAAAWLGRRARGLSMAAVGILVLLGLGWPPFVADQSIPGYSGWLLFALLVMFIGAEHPPALNDVTVLKSWRLWVAIGTLLLILVTFTPVPLS